MKYSAYENRKKTDTFFTPQNGSAVYTGQLSDAIHYIEQAQLMDPALWSLLVEQFRIGNVDDHDFGWRSEYWGKMVPVLHMRTRKTRRSIVYWKIPYVIF